MDNEKECIFYEDFRIQDGNSYNCILCGEPAEYMRGKYTWCEEHKNNLDKNSEDLEKMINEIYEITTD